MGGGVAGWIDGWNNTLTPHTGGRMGLNRPIATQKNHMPF